MCDDKHCPILEEIMECIGDLLLREAVERTRRLIQDNDLRILDKQFRNGKALLLSTAQPDSPLSDLSFQTRLKIIDEIAL